MASIFSLFGEIFIDNEKANKSIDDTTTKGESMGSKIGDAFGNIVKGAAAVGTAVIGAATSITAGAYAMISDTADAADHIDKLSERTGINREELQRWEHAAAQSGVNVDSFANGVKKMSDVLDTASSALEAGEVDTVKLAQAQAKLSNAQLAVEKSQNNMAKSQIDYNAAVEKYGENSDQAQKALLNLENAQLAVEAASNNAAAAQEAYNQAAEPAAAGSNAATEALGKLGIALEDLDGLSTEEKFEKITSALADMEEGTERNAIGNDLLGKTYTEMLPLLNAGSDGIAALKKEADDLGIVMSEDAVNAGVVFGDTIANIKDAATGLKNQFSTALLPIFQQVADKVLEHLPTIQGLVDKMTPVITELFEKMLPPLFDLAEQLIPVIMDLIIQLLPTIMEIISEVLPILTDLIVMLLPPIVEIVNMILPVLLELIDALLPLLKPILDLLQPFIDLLMMIIEPLVELLNLILPPIIEVITNIMNFILPILQEKLSFVADLLGGAFKAAFDTISNGFTTFKDVLSGIIDFVVKVFTGDWKGAWEAVKNIFSTIFDGIKNAFKIPINFIIDGINAFIRGLNKIQIPDWVPVVGGKGFDIKEFERLRIGIDYVPYDDMPALLHKGEQVLTASEAKEYKQSKENQSESSGNNVDVSIELKIENFINSSDQDINDLIDLIMELIQEKIKRKGDVFN